MNQLRLSDDPAFAPGTAQVPLDDPFDLVFTSHTVSQFATDRPVEQNDSFRLLLVTQGTLVVHERTEEIVLDVWRALFLPPLRTALLSFEEDCEFFYFAFRPVEKEATVSQLLRIPERVRVAVPARMIHLLSLVQGQDTGADLPRRIVSHALALILCELADNRYNQICATSCEDGLEIISSRVDAYIAAHYHQSFSTEDVAMELHYSPQYLERAYRTERGVSISGAIHQRRIKEACALLLNQRGSGVARIAGLCGYRDTSYFRRVFKRFTNMTPHDYRVSSSRHAS